MKDIKLKILTGEFSVNKLNPQAEINFDLHFLNKADGFICVSKTEEELSVVAKEPLDEKFDKETLKKEKGWCCFYIDDVLAFNLVGIIAKISSILGEKDISVFVISTFNTDYILIKKEKLKEAISALESHGYKFI